MYGRVRLRFNSGKAFWNIIPMNRLARSFDLIPYEWLLVILIVAGFFLRVWTWEFFEFKDDQARAIADASATVASRFMISHGMMSGVGIPNLPGFYFFMGVASMIFHDPSAYAAVFIFISCLTVPVWLIGMRGHLSRETLLETAALLSLAPSLVLYSSNIWAQSLLPPIMTAYFCLTVRWLSGGSPWHWIGSCWLAFLAASLHLSGFFVLPATFCFAWMGRAKPRTVLIAVGPVFVLLLPYLLYLVRFVPTLPAAAPVGHFAPLMNRTLILVNEFHSFEFFNYYFGPDLGRISAWLLGAGACLPLRMAAAAAAVFMLLGALGVAARFMPPHQRGSWRSDQTILCGTVALLMLGSVCLSYMLLQIRAYPHYFLVTVPAGFVLLALGFSVITSKLVRKAFFAIVVISNAVLLSSALLFLDMGGGHPLEYGPSYRLLVDWGGELASLAASTGKKPTYDVLLKESARPKFDIGATRRVIDSQVGGDRAATERTDRPNFVLVIEWNRQRLAYEAVWLAQ